MRSSRKRLWSIYLAMIRAKLRTLSVLAKDGRRTRNEMRTNFLSRAVTQQCSIDSCNSCFGLRVLAFAMRLPSSRGQR